MQDEINLMKVKLADQTQSQEQTENENKILKRELAQAKQKLLT